MELSAFFKFIHQDLQSGLTIIFACLVIVCIACFIDMWTGIDAARANKEKIRSRPLRKTGAKIVDYFKLLVFFIMIDLLGLCFPWYMLPYGCVIGTLGILIVEGLSVTENLKKKRSHAAEVVDIAAKIVSCSTSDEAKKIIEIIKSKQHEGK